MAVLPTILRNVSFTVAGVVALYALALGALTNPSLQRHILYAHKAHTTFWHNPNEPEQFGFAKNQITAFNFSTPDHELLYAWHVMPLGLYARHEAEMLREPSGCAEDMTQTRAFKLMTESQETKLVINFHGNAGSVAQGWRPDIYRSLADGSTSDIHIIAPDYRGFGYSSGSPTEEGLITDGIATVNWAVHVAKIPPERIAIVGHSLGTAVSIAVVEAFAKNGTEFAGLVLNSGFTEIPNLLQSYAMGGIVPVLAPLKRLPALRKYFERHIVDIWPSADRLANFVRISKRVRLFIVHAKDDSEIPYTQSDGLFLAAANATTSTGMDLSLLAKMKARGTVNTGKGTYVSTWKAERNKIIREQVVGHGGHNRVMTFAPVALAVLKAFELDDGGLLPED